MLKINMEFRKGILFIRLKGNLNANTVGKFREYTMPIIKDYGIKYLVYNFNDLMEIDSFGESALIEEQEQINVNNGKVLLVNNKINTTVGFDNVSNELIALDLLKV